MKNINKRTLFLSLLILLIAFSAVSMIASPAEVRYTWTGINPWNGIQGIPMTLNRFLNLGAGVTYTLSALIVAYLWWRIYALITKLGKRRTSEEE